MDFRARIGPVVAVGLLLAAGPALGQAAEDPLPPDLDSLTAPNTDSTAQEDLPNESAVPIPQPKSYAALDAYAPRGIDLGGLKMYPSITLGPVFTSNAAASPDGSADAGANVGPSLQIQSDWVRHSFTADAEGDFDFYVKNSDLDARDVNATSTLTLDVRRGTSLALTGSYVLTQSGLEDNDVPASAIGLQTEQVATASVQLTHSYGPLDLAVAGAASYNVFGDVKLQGGGKQDNSDRDYFEPALGIRATYTDAPVFQPFVEIAYAPRRHVETRDRNGLDRNSDGYALGAGFRIANDPVWQGELALTYLWRNYADASLNSQSIVGLNGAVTWAPTEITSIVFSFSTDLDETTTAGASAAKSWDFGVEATRAVQDNVDLTASGNIGVSDEDGPTDVTYTAGLGIDWRMSPVLAWSAAYDFTWLDAAQSSRNYVEHLVTAGITLSR